MIRLRTSGTEAWVPTAEDTPFQRVGGEEGIRTLVHRFYDLMEAEEPALLATHELEDGRVSAALRERVALYLIGWLGGPQDYTERYGHPRLRMRHVRVPVDMAMRDAWTRCMAKAMQQVGLAEPVRVFLEQRFVDLADHLRNRPG